MLCAVGMNVVGRPLIGLLFGERYLAAIDLLLPIRSMWCRWPA